MLRCGLQLCRVRQVASARNFWTRTSQDGQPAGNGIGRCVVILTAAGAAGGIATTMWKGSRRIEDAEALMRSNDEKPIPSRDANLARLKSGETFDLLVVGGGCTGAGVALEAQLRGLKVALVEQEDFASGTSSKSTKLLWAGSRYLVKGLVKLFSPQSVLHPLSAWEEFMGTWHMVLGCFTERTYMLTMNKHLTNWVPIAVPLDKWLLWPPPFDYPPAALGPATGLFVIFFKAYDALSLWMAPSSYVMLPSRVREVFPQLDWQRMKYVSVFYEGAHNDARTNLSIAFTAAAEGTCLTNYTKVDEVIFDGSGQARGAMVSDRTRPGEAPFKVNARKVVYAGGPFTDDMRKISEGPNVKEVVNGSGGTHIVLPQYFCPRHMGMVDMATSRGSFLFYLPWEGHTLVGTTDVKTKPDLHHVVPEDEIEYLISECQKYLSPDLKVRRSDVLSAWYGIRPLCADPNASDQSSISRDHIVSHHPSNDITFISGGKWTTWREMAEDCVNQVIEKDPALAARAGPSVSLQQALIGSGKTADFPEGYHENVVLKLVQKTGVAQDVAEHLVRNYGTRAMDVLRCCNATEAASSQAAVHPRIYEDSAAAERYPYLEAEVKYAVQQEYACKAADILARRTRLAFVNSTAAQLSIPRVVEIMGDCLGWDAARRQQEVKDAQEVMSKDFAGPIPQGKLS
mmetsp:Transcript_44025/g.101591  ORF Transcript_44025/g.101591 Transcript_44025/m.101591 type:complete len:684 (-) Transcript_44025:36-2087(-)